MRKTVPGKSLARLLLVTLAVLVTSASLLSAGEEPTPAEKPLHKVVWLSDYGAFGIFMSEPLAADLKLPARGALVAAVLKGSVFETAGIRRGDLIVSIETVEEPVKTSRIGVLRKGRQLSFTVSVREHSRDRGHLVETAASTAEPRTIVVDPTGKGDYRTIAAALMIADRGDTVKVNDGVYLEGLLVPGGVTLEAAEAGGVHIRAPKPLMVACASSVALKGLSLARGGLSVTESTDVSITGCSFSGEPETTGILIKASQVHIANNIITGHSTGIRAEAHSEAHVSENLLDANSTSIAALDSKLTATKNTITGTGSDGRGIDASKVEFHLAENSIRHHSFGIFIPEGKGRILNNVISQNNYAIFIGSGDCDVNENILLSNADAGVVLYAQDGSDGALREARITKNTISANGGSAIYARRFRVEARFNLLDGNGSGLSIDHCHADVRNNTVVLQKQTGIHVGPDSHLAIYNNIIAFNHQGIGFDVSSKCEGGFNNVFGNIASRVLPPVDGNYVSSDWIPTRAGDKIGVNVYPAYDLKADTDMSVDPDFVRTGSDYRLSADSPLARSKGKDSSLIGAFPVQ